MEENNQNQNENVGAEATAKESTGTTEVTENKKNYEELSKTDKELQSYVDRRVTVALKTAKTKWQEDLQAEKTEDEKLAQMNENQKLQYKLKKQEEENLKIQKILNALLLASPITWIIIAITALIAIIVLCIMHWNEIKERIINVCNNIKETVSQWIESIKQFFSDLWQSICDIFSGIGQWFLVDLMRQ